jgi:predicted PurR-regulated permease PerM
VCGAIYLMTPGQMTEGGALAVWGMAVVGTIDNLLRPVLVGRDAKMHDILILIGTLGGLASFGVAGLVAGPVLAGLFVTVWTSLNERAGIDTNEDAPPDPPEDAPPQDAAAPGPFDDDPALVAQIAELRRRHDARQDPAD